MTDSDKKPDDGQSFLCGYQDLRGCMSHFREVARKLTTEKYAVSAVELEPVSGRYKFHVRCKLCDLVVCEDTVDPRYWMKYHTKIECHAHGLEMAARARRMRRDARPANSDRCRCQFFAVELSMWTYRYGPTEGARKMDEWMNAANDDTDLHHPNCIEGGRLESGESQEAVGDDWASGILEWLAQLDTRPMSEAARSAVMTLVGELSTQVGGEPIVNGRLSFQAGYLGNQNQWCYWDTDNPERGITGPYPSFGAALRDAHVHGAFQE